MEEREGTIESIMGNHETGVLKDNRDGKIREFTNPAILELNIGDGVNYILINTPKGEISVVKTKR